MSKYIILTIEAAKAQGFPFRLEVEGQIRCDGILIELYQLRQHWGRLSTHFPSGSTRKLVAIDQIQWETQATHRSFRHCQNWFVTRGNELEAIRNVILEELQSQEEIYLMIQTSDLWIKKLPWYDWDILSEQSQIEFAMLVLQTQPVRSSPVIADRIAARNKMRILVVFGNAIGIDMTRDEAALRALPNVDMCFLNQPDARGLSDHLRDEIGWDILFFAGHSSSSINGETGIINLNQEYSLTISDLRKALSKAIGRGLQLAIFNSCDGLGLANQLADLQIPQVIVMRESVPDRVAQIFAEVFLKAFAGGKSVHRSVRAAREQLQQYGKLKSSESISGLPTICQIAVQTEVIWRQNPRVDYSPPIPPKPLWKVMMTITAQTAITMIAVTEKKIISASNRAKLIQVWEFPSGDFHHSLAGQTQAIRAIAVHPQEPKIAIALDRTIKVWNLQTEQLEPDQLNYRGTFYTPSTIAISPDGKKLATGHPIKGKIKLWDMETGKLLHALRGSFWGTWSLISADAFLISATVQYPIQCWDWRTGKRVQMLNGISGPFRSLRNWFRRDAGPRCIAVSPNQKLFATADFDNGVKIWDIYSQIEPQHLGTHEDVQAIAFSPDGKMLATGGGTKVQLWNLQTGKLEDILIHSGDVTCLTWESESHHLVTGSQDGFITIWQKQ
jgi:CHAT domain/Anaphase-promoting complex subunit 4 WD40 domain/WD domain, G-beta repeat